MLLSDTSFYAFDNNGLLKVVAGNFTRINNNNNIGGEIGYFLNESLGFFNEYINRDTSYIVRTLDSGKTWTRVYLDTSGYGRINKHQFLDSLNGYLFNFFQRELYTTNDGGRSWYLDSFPLNGQVVDFEFLDTNIGYVSSRGDVYRTNDGGQTWQNESAPATYLSIAGIVDSSIAYFYGGSFNIYKRSPLVTNIEERNFEENKLSVYPNPSSDRIYIKNIDLSRNYNVSIYDIKGSLLLSGQQTDFDISGFKNGLYILQLETDRNLFTTKFQKVGFDN